MSAWIVHKSHVDAIVQLGIVTGVVSMSDATTTGRMLWLENHRSIEARYGDPVPEEVIEGYEFEGVEAKLDDLTMRKNLGCYAYQTCEVDDWEQGNAAFDLILRLEDILDAHLGTDEYHTLPGYRDRPWGINDIRQAIAS